MLKIAIMQPYFFPYIGYWQMFNAVDKFVILDDVNFIMRGYINRNSILLNHSAHKFSIPLKKPSQNKLINETKLNFSTHDKENFLKTISMAYKKAPYFKDFYPIMEEIIYYNNDDLTTYLKNSFEKVKQYLNLKTEILLSSEIPKDNTLKAQARIIEINKKLNARIYINAIGGLELYDAKSFKKENIELKFIKMRNIKYKQFNNDFVANLSFIDILMFNSKAEIAELLEQYDLITKEV